MVAVTSALIILFMVYRVRLCISLIMQSSQITAAADKKLELTLPDAGDWDPNYSNEQLLQEENAEANCIASEFAKVVQIDQAMMTPDTFGGIGRLNDESTSNSSAWRMNVPVQGSPNVEMGSPPSVYNGPASYAGSIQKTSLFPRHLSPTFSSRFGQLQFHHSNHGRPSVHYGTEGTHMKLQQNSFCYDPGNPQFRRGSSLNNGSPWGMLAFYLSKK